MKKIMLMHIAIALCLILIIPGASSQTITGFAKTEIRTADKNKCSVNR
jgi:hypothetical protein